MIDVSCAIIRNDDDNVLIVQRGEGSDHPYKWEFPGGKIRTGESPEDSIMREIDEELSMDIIIIEEQRAVEYDYDIKKIKLFPFICDTLDEKPCLSEHLDYKWMKPDELLNADLCEADIIVAKQYISGIIHEEVSHDIVVTEIKAEEKEQIKEMLTEKGGFDACDILAENIIVNKHVRKLLVDFCFSKDSTLAFRASYCITRAEEKAPGLTREYYPLYAESLQILDNESVIRAFLKMLNSWDYNELDEKYHGIIADNCFRWLNNKESAIAIKAYSMEAVFKLTRIYPELQNELSASIMHLMQDGSAGIKARGKQILKMMSK